MSTQAPQILILEDDAASRFVLRTVLESSGFSVLDSADAESAISYCTRKSEPIDLMITDVVLRGSHGPEIMGQLQALRPEMPFLFISGYPLEQLANRRLIDSRIMAGEKSDFLQKPFTADSLLYAVHKLLDKA